MGQSSIRSVPQPIPISAATPGKMTRMVSRGVAETAESDRRATGRSCAGARIGELHIGLNQDLAGWLEWSTKSISRVPQPIPISAATPGRMTTMGQSSIRSMQQPIPLSAATIDNLLTFRVSTAKITSHDKADLVPHDDSSLPRPGRLD